MRRSGKKDGGPSEHCDAAEQPDPSKGLSQPIVGRIDVGRLEKIVFVLIHDQLRCLPFLQEANLKAEEESSVIEHMAAIIQRIARSASAARIG